MSLWRASSVNDVSSSNEGSLYHTVDGAVDAKTSLLGSQFAQYVALKAYASAHGGGGTSPQQRGLRKGRSTAPRSPIRPVDAFKQVFFMDPKHNPALSNTHICYEYDAHYKDAEKDWSRAGKKFSDEPRIGKPPSSDHGPFKREELPQYCEKEQHIFGKTRKLKPFSRAQQYTRPIDRCTIPYRPTQDDETSHLGPGKYVVPDPWRAKSGHGNIYGTHPLLSHAKGRDEFDAILPTKESQYHQQLTGSFEVTAKSPKAALRRAASTGHFAKSPKSITSRGRPNTAADILQSKLMIVTTPCMAIGGAAGMSFFDDSGTDWDFHRPTTTASKLHQGGGREAASAFHPSRKKGFAFSKSTFATSSIDVTTGTTNADLLYRRIRQKDGSPLIYAISKSVGIKDMPKGSVEEQSWATEQLKKDETLAVVSNMLSPIGGSHLEGYSLDRSFIVNSDMNNSFSSYSPPVMLQQPSFDDSRVVSLPGPISSPLLKNLRNSPFLPPTVVKERPSRSLIKPRTAPLPQPIFEYKFSVRAADLLALSSNHITEPADVAAAAAAVAKKKNDALGAHVGGSSRHSLGNPVGLDASLIDSLQSQFMA